MGFTTDFLRRKKSPSGDITNDELKSHHSYQNDLLADGFISPIVLPSDRSFRVMWNRILMMVFSELREPSLLYASTILH